MCKANLTLTFLTLALIGCGHGLEGAHADGGGSPEGGVTPDGGPIVGQLDGSPPTTLPPLPELTNVVGQQREDSVGIDFDPFGGAIDYRVYPLPKDSDVTVNADGSTTIKNAVYRCAGLRQTYDLPSNLNPDNGTLAKYDQFMWGATIPASPTLGYVYVTAAPNRLPVYAVAGHGGGPNELEWRETRAKIYTTDQAQRTTLLGQGWRDDGIVFYVPQTASGATHTIYHSEAYDSGRKQYTEYYFTDADKAARAGDNTPPAPAFQVLSATEAGAQPLMAVFYMVDNSHTELAVGNERFTRTAYQGQGPLWHLEWTGITQPTTLVVEALASGCPFQGFLSPQHLSVPPHQTLYTLDDLKAASSTGEVFINGQYDTTTVPKAIARSFINVAPQPHNPADWDWYQGFNVGTNFGPLTPMPCQGFNCARWTSPTFDLSGYTLDVPNGVPLLTYGQFLGQLWTVFDDFASDSTGKIRFTALQKANVDSDASKFLHVTWSVDIVGTDRRYPQLLVSDQDAPLAETIANPTNNTLLVQTIEGPATRFEVQAIHGLVNGKPWDINNQASEHRLIDTAFWDSYYQTHPDPNSMVEPMSEHAGMDRMTKFDAYISNSRIYVFLDGTPAGCTQYPSGFALRGPVTVTFGDTLYHEGAADEGVCGPTKPFSFMHRHQCSETKRHFDDLGFKSGVPAPAWDEGKFPCGPY